MLCKSMLLVEVDKEAVSRMLGQSTPENVECAMTVCSRFYCEGPTDDSICAHYEQGSGAMVCNDDV